MSKNHLKFILAITVLVCQFSLVCAQPINKEWIESFEKNTALKPAERIADRQSWSKEKLDAFDTWLDELRAARLARLDEVRAARQARLAERSKAQDADLDMRINSIDQLAAEINSMPRGNEKLDAENAMRHENLRKLIAEIQMLPGGEEKLDAYLAKKTEYKKKLDAWIAEADSKASQKEFLIALAQITSKLNPQIKELTNKLKPGAEFHSLTNDKTLSKVFTGDFIPFDKARLDLISIWFKENAMKLPEWFNDNDVKSLKKLP